MVFGAHTAVFMRPCEYFTLPQFLHLYMKTKRTVIENATVENPQIKYQINRMPSSRENLNEKRYFRNEIRTKILFMIK